MSLSMQPILRRAPVIPVIVLRELRHAVPLAEALAGGGLPVLEITLRTPVAFDAVQAIRKAVPQAVVGVGTLTQPAQFAQAADAGAQFGVSPGLTPALAAAAREAPFPYLPGVMTPGELLRALESGFDCCKLFPAQQAGGPAALRALHAVVPQATFCPTGGITAENAGTYLALPNVLCVGGSWVAPDNLVRDGDWAAIGALARAAAALRAT